MQQTVTFDGAVNGLATFGGMCLAIIIIFMAGSVLRNIFTNEKTS